MDRMIMRQEDITKIHVSLAKIETLQMVANKEFEEHKKEDRVHFDRIYDTLEDYVLKMGENTTALKVFNTKVVAWVTGISATGIALSAGINIYLKLLA